MQLPQTVNQRGPLLAARMMDQSSGHQADWNSDDAFDGQSMSEAAAGSTVVRGLLYSLIRPAARRFLSLKSPALFTNNKAAASNKEQLQHLCWADNRSAVVLSFQNLFCSDVALLLGLVGRVCPICLATEGSRHGTLCLTHVHPLIWRSCKSSGTYCRPW